MTATPERKDLCQGEKPPHPWLGRQFASAREAIQVAAANKPVVIRLDGKILIVLKHEADRLAAEGVEFAYLTEYDGRIVTVPVN